MQADALPALPDEFDALDLCHRQTIVALGRLSALIRRLEVCGVDAHARELASQIVPHFARTVRRHHAEEERLVFPALARDADLELVEKVLKLQQDHCWLEEDWMELEPHLQAIAHGQGPRNLDTLRSGAGIFSALSLEHIALEESVVYPQAKSRLNGLAAGNEGRLAAMQSRSMRQQSSQP